MGAVLTVGNDDWPMPVPLVKTGYALALRRRGRPRGGAGAPRRPQRARHHPDAQAIADAQVEYARVDRGSGRLAYAQKFRQPREEGRPVLAGGGRRGESPLGPLVAQAAGRLHDGEAHALPRLCLPDPDGPGQGRAGGAYDYVVKGAMIGGFAVVAYPASYGISGVMTFL